MQDEKYDAELEAVRRLADAGHPVIIIRLENRYDVGQEILRWEIATAAAGFVLRINPFNQPNVQESKDNTKRLLDTFRTDGSLPKPDIGDHRQAVSVTITDEELHGKLEKLMTTVRSGDYIAIQAYMAEAPDTNRILQDIRTYLRDHLQVATTIGYGPRYLHSTGQYHKGGPNTGIYLQLKRETKNDVSLPDEDYSYSILIKAQAQGDFEALARRDRRIVSIDLGAESENGLKRLKEAILKLSYETVHGTVG